MERFVEWFFHLEERDRVFYNWCLVGVLVVCAHWRITRLISFDIFVMSWLVKIVLSTYFMSKATYDGVRTMCKQLNPTMLRHLFDKETKFDNFLTPFAIVLLIPSHVDFLSTYWLDTLMCLIFSVDSVFLFTFYYFFIVVWIKGYNELDIDCKLSEYNKFKSNDNRCTVCWELMRHDHDVIILECNHGLHLACWKQCIQFKCPICRRVTRVVYLWNLRLAKKYAKQCELVREKRSRCVQIYEKIYLLYLYLKYALASVNQRTGGQDTNSH